MKANDFALLRLLADGAFHSGERLAELHEECRDYMITQADIVAIIRAPRTTVSSWVARGRLTAGSVDADGVERYRYGDALDLNESRQSRGA